MPSMDNAHALVIGIANYQHVRSLPTTVLDDAQAIAAVLKDEATCAYAPDNVHLLLDGEATRAAMVQALADLAAKTNADSTVCIYLSSHGGSILDGPHAGCYIIPVDTDPTTNDTLAATAFAGADFTAALHAIPAGKIVVLFDCCHAGGIGDPKDAAAPALANGLTSDYLDTLKSGRGRVIFASSRDSESSWVLPGAKNSLFTQYLLEGLQGGAPGPGGVIRVFDLFDYVQPLVTAAQAAQHPIFKVDVEENFPIALYHGGVAPPLPPAVPPADAFVYDVFISYFDQNPDKTWVHKTLLPRLEADGPEAKGLKACIDYRDFSLGGALVTEMVSAVQQSRYTLTVLSPDYLTSGFTEFESVLAEHLGLLKHQRRMISIIRQDCTPPLDLSFRMMLDMTDDDEFETDIARLIAELRKPPILAATS